jgi:ABC-2 type transport system permease protein
MHAWPIFKREVRTYLGSPIAYVVVASFAVISGYFFYSILSFFHLMSVQAGFNPAMAGQLNITEGVLRPFLRNLSVVMLLVMPLLTMRLFSEEKKSGTIELLLTLPVRDLDVLVGKYLAAVALFAGMLAVTGISPLLLVPLVRLEWGPLLTGYLGLLLLGMAFIALGVLTSSLTENQVVAAMAAFGALLLFWVIAWSADVAGAGTGKVLQHLSIIGHYDSFSKGVIETKDVIYYLNFIIFCLFLTLRSLESKRWRG